MQYSKFEREYAQIITWRCRRAKRKRIERPNKEKIPTNLSLEASRDCTPTNCSLQRLQNSTPDWRARAENNTAEIYISLSFEQARLENMAERSGMGQMIVK